MSLASIWACYEAGRRSWWDCSGYVLNMSRCASLIWGVGIIHCTKMKGLNRRGEASSCSSASAGSYCLAPRGKSGLIDRVRLMLFGPVWQIAPRE
jgi:hypothetical protein